jgi:phosphoenolpyruvate---glycerone phosphotransferase subunit DhaL
MWESGWVVARCRACLHSGPIRHPLEAHPTTNLATPSTARQPALDGAAVRAALRECHRIVDRHQAWLTRLDAVLGDGDHGENLAIGFRAVDELLDELPAETRPGELLRAVGHRLVATVGGASGPLYGTAFIEAGFRAGDAAVLDTGLLLDVLDAAADGLARRGRCRVGDKTILDTLAPAAAAYGQAIADGAAAADAWSAAIGAAAHGARATRAMPARRGLALRLGDRSIGHLDPGAVSCLFLLVALGRRPRS